MAASTTSAASTLKRVVPLLPAAPGTLEALTVKLTGIEAISAVHIDDQHRLHLRYDASVMNLRDIERLLDESGVGRPATLWWRLKSAWYRFVDGNARSNALSSGGACCSRPPSPWGASRPDRDD